MTNSMKRVLLSELRIYQYIPTQDCLYVSVPQTPPPLFNILSYPLTEGFGINGFPAYVHCRKSFTADLTNLPLHYCRRPNVLLFRVFDIYFLMVHLWQQQMAGDSCFAMSECLDLWLLAVRLGIRRMTKC